MSLTCAAEEERSKADDVIWGHLKGHSILVEYKVSLAIKKATWFQLSGGNVMILATADAKEL